MRKNELAKELGVSRKTLYNYLDILHITEINENTINQLKEYSKTKNKSKKISKSELLEELERVKTENIKLSENNSFLENGQKALLDQIEYLKNELEPRIKAIESSIALLTYKDTSKEKKSFISRLFGKK